MGNNYPSILGFKSMINYDLELLFQAMQHVDFDIYKSISHMDENEIQQLGECFFAAYAPTGDVNLVDNQNDVVPF